MSEQQKGSLFFSIEMGSPVVGFALFVLCPLHLMFIPVNQRAETFFFYIYLLALVTAFAFVWHEFLGNWKLRHYYRHQ